MTKTNLMKMTRQQHNEVYIKLNFEDYSEVFTVYELASDGSFTIEELQLCCDLDGEEYTPRSAEGIDVETMQLVKDDEEESESHDYEYELSWRNEIAREAGAMYGMQGYYDHLGYDIDFEPEDGDCFACGGRGCDRCY